MVTGTEKTNGKGQKLKVESSKFKAVLGLLLLSTFNFRLSTAFCQQPQTSTAPVFAANAKYVQGVGPGYWPTAGAGLTLNLSAGTAFCNAATVNYAGGTLTLAANQTNYVYLDPAASCAPASNITGFSIGQIPIAKVVTDASAISSITDLRNWFVPLPCTMSSAGAVTCAALGTDQNLTLAPTGTGFTQIGDKLVTPYHVIADWGAEELDLTTNYDPARDLLRDPSKSVWDVCVSCGGDEVSLWRGAPTTGIPTLTKKWSVGSAGDMRVENDIFTPRLNNIRFADQFPGADACAQINNAAKDLFVQGGVVDARNFFGPQTCATDPFADVTAPSGVLLLGEATFNVSATWNIPANWTVRGIYGGRKMSAPTTDFDNGAVLKWTGAANGIVVKIFNVHHVIFQDFTINGNATNGVTGILLNSDGTIATHNIVLDNFNIYQCAVGLQWGTETPPYTSSPQISDAQIRNFHIASNVQNGPSTGISTISRASNIVTVVLAANAILSAGDTVTIAGVTDPSFNGTFVITSVSASNGTTYTYNQAGSDASSTGGTCTRKFSEGIIISSGGAATDSLVEGGAIQVVNIGVDVRIVGYVAFKRLSCGSLAGTTPRCFRVVTTNQLIIEECESENGAAGVNFVKAPTSIWSSTNGVLSLLYNIMNEPVNVEQPTTVLSIGNKGPASATLNNASATLISIGDRVSPETGWTLTAGKLHSLAGGGLVLDSSSTFGWTDSSGTKDTLLQRDAANVLALRNATNAQAFNVYNTYTSGSNYERGFVSFVSNKFSVGTEKAGSGTVRGLDLVGTGITFYPLGNHNSSAWAMTSAGNFYAQTDNTYDIGAVGANRPRSVYAASRVVSGLNVVTFSATPTFDASLGNTQKITLTDNVTSSTLSNAVAGQTINFIICQDATGGRTFAWPTNVLGGVTIGSTASKCSAQNFIFDGTNAYAVSPGVTNM
jgi:hypothetical protein